VTGPARLLVVAVASAMLVGALAGVSRHAPSAAGGSTIDFITHPAMTADETCATWAAWWQTGSGLGIDSVALEAISQCRETVDGAWIFPDGDGDPALKRAVVDFDDAETAAARAQLVADLELFRSRMNRSTVDALAVVFDGVAGGEGAFVAEGRNVAAERKTYERAVAAILASPDLSGVRAYIDWAIAREIGGYEAVQARCQMAEFGWLHFACDGLERDMAIGATPWPWELEDSWSIDAYLAEQRAAM